jgi:hexosaminidase
MKKLLVEILFFGLAATVFAADTNELAIIPLPQKMEMRDGAFKLLPDIKIVTDFSSRKTGKFLAARLRKSTGYPAKTSLKFISSAAVANGILLTTKNAGTNLGAEGYQLIVATNSVVIRAPTQAGLFYGVQTLLQLLHPEIFSTNIVANANWQIPDVQIEDWPRFQWRGLMLDVSRHFFTKEEVKQLLDAMALLKLNTFHWHLVDDQGWRIEIKKYPKLTQIGAWRSGVGFNLDPKSTTAYGPDGRYGGFYTQTDIREVVAYAAARHITIVPEIEMPGHSTAALAAYPQLSSTVGTFAMLNTGGVFNGIYDPAKEATFKFLDDVLTEVIQLFPGKYVHIGGDEVPKKTWKKSSDCQALMKRESLKNEDELQSWFTRRIEKFVSTHGRTMIGWSEIIRGGLAQNAAVMDWIGGATEAASAGHDVVMSPKANCYFDYYQSQDHSTEPRAIGGFLPLAKVYAFEPIPADLAPQFQGHILGAQGIIWTEYIPNLKQAEFMAFPRLTALAEVVWSPKTARDFDDFNRRLLEHNRRVDLAGVNYRRETSVKVGGWAPEQISTDGATMEWDVTKNVDAAGPRRVTFDPITGSDGIDIAWAALLENGREISRDEHAGYSGDKPCDPSSPCDPVYTLNVPAPKPGAHYTLRTRVAGSGGTDSRGEINWCLKPMP